MDYIRTVPWHLTPIVNSFATATSLPTDPKHVEENSGQMTSKFNLLAYVHLYYND